MQQIYGYLETLAQYVSRLRALIREWIGHENENARCPGCGNRRGMIKFSVDDRVIAHKCLVCNATWGKDPVVPAAKWAA